MSFRDQILAYVDEQKTEKSRAIEIHEAHITEFLNTNFGGVADQLRELREMPELAREYRFVTELDRDPATGDEGISLSLVCGTRTLKFGLYPRSGILLHASGQRNLSRGAFEKIIMAFVAPAFGA